MLAFRCCSLQAALSEQYGFLQGVRDSAGDSARSLQHNLGQMIPPYGGYRKGQKARCPLAQQKVEMTTHEGVPHNHDTAANAGLHLPWPS